MDEEHITQGSTSVDGEDPVTSVTGNEAEHEDPVTSVTGNEAEHENPVTSVTSEKPDTKVIRVNVTDIERIMVRGYEGEKPALIVHRMLDKMDELVQIESDHEALISEAAGMHDNIEELKGIIEDLSSGAGTAGTAVVPGQPSFSLKDAMTSLKDVCDDDSVRLKFASKMLETQMAAANSHLAREHDAEQKRLDREDKDKDRALKKELAESRANHDKDMTMIKKGMVRKEDLEDIVFLGQKNASPADRLKNQKELAARQAAHEEDETGNLDPPGEDPAYD